MYAIAAMRYATTATRNAIAETQLQPTRGETAAEKRIARPAHCCQYAIAAVARATASIAAVARATASIAAVACAAAYIAAVARATASIAPVARATASLANAIADVACAIAVVACGMPPRARPR